MKELLKRLSSLRLTVWLLTCSMVLIFFGTLAQVNTGIWKTQKDYFESFFVVWNQPQQLHVAHKAPDRWKSLSYGALKNAQAKYAIDPPESTAFVTISAIANDNAALLAALNDRRTAAGLNPFPELKFFPWTSVPLAKLEEAFQIDTEGEVYADSSLILRTTEGIWLVSLHGEKASVLGAKSSFSEFLNGIKLQPKNIFLHALHIPMPGGYTIGGLLLLNLAAAFYVRFKAKWSKAGIYAIHIGLITLIVSELLTDILAVESNMLIQEGDDTNYSTKFRSNELVFIDRSHPDHDRVHSIPASLLKEGAVIDVPDTPLSIRVVSYYPAADYLNTSENMENPASQGAGARMGMIAQPTNYSYADNAVNTAAAYVKVIGPDGSLGTWLTSLGLDDRYPPQMLGYGDQEWEIRLRQTRIYHTFRMELIDFKFDRYPGTEIPFNYSSEVIVHPYVGNQQKALIYMNHPLRYEGLTFYQSSFTPDETGTVLQVVRNPGWLLPYVSVLLMGLGMIYQFAFHFTKFLKKHAG